MTAHSRIWHLTALLAICSTPLCIMYLYQLIDSLTHPVPGSLLPGRLDLNNWRFLWGRIDSAFPSIWHVTWNTFLFASATTALVTSLSLTSAYALSRLNMPGRPWFLGGLIILHAFPTITLIIAIFITLQYLNLYDSLIGVICVKAALELPLGVWIMKGFYDNVPWEIEMAGLQDGASRFQVWWQLVLPQIRPGLSAILVLIFLSAWSEFILPTVLAPGANVQVLATYMNAVLADDTKMDFGLFKAIGMFYSLPVILIYLIFQKQLMNIYDGGTKG